MKIVEYKTIKNPYLGLVKEASCDYGETVNSPQQIAKMMNELFCAGATEEYVYLCCFTNKNKLLGVFEISHGTINRSLISSREVMIKALMMDAVSIALVHNHPSGDVTPSKEDCAVTEMIYKAAELLQITMMDHIIVNGQDDDYYSFFEKERLSPT